jgi:DNA-directed RNA polymerase specialized sigma24 family protein
MRDLRAWLYRCFRNRVFPYSPVRSRKRRRHRDFFGLMLIVCALLVLVLWMPGWFVALLLCAVLVHIGYHCMK